MNNLYIAWGITYLLGSSYILNWIFKIAWEERGNRNSS